MKYFFSVNFSCAARHSVLFNIFGSADTLRSTCLGLGADIKRLHCSEYDIVRRTKRERNAYDNRTADTRGTARFSAAEGRSVVAEPFSRTLVEPPRPRFASGKIWLSPPLRARNIFYCPYTSRPRAFRRRRIARYVMCTTVEPVLRRSPAPSGQRNVTYRAGKTNSSKTI